MQMPLTVTVTDIYVGVLKHFTQNKCQMQKVQWYVNTSIRRRNKLITNWTK